MRDLLNNINPLVAIAPAAAVTDNTPWVSAIIDTQGYESVTFVLITGTEADADATFAVLLEDGAQADLSDHAEVDASLVLGSEALAGFDYSVDNKTRKVGYKGGKRYVRLTVTPSNNAAGAYLAATAILGHPHDAPTPNPPA